MVNKLLGLRGRMFPGGHFPEVALGGFLLQGELGLRLRKIGGSRRSIEDGTIEDMALSMQTDHCFAAYVIWEDQAEDPKCQSWLAHIFEKINRDSEGSYLGDADFQKRSTAFWGRDQGKRLMDIRRKWDPQGIVAGYLNKGDQNGVEGLENVHKL